MVRLRLDSEYVLKGLLEWMDNWKRRGWRTAAGKPVKNAEQWRALDAARRALRGKGIDLQADWGRSHTADMGNERVDRMAAADRDRHAASVAAGGWGAAGSFWSLPPPSARRDQRVAEPPPIASGCRKISSS